MNGRPVIEILREIGIRLDRETQKVVKILEKTDFANETDLVETFDIKINDIRKSLYILSGLGLASYVKIKDENKKWWYVYNWHLEKSRIHYKYISFLRNQLHQKENTLAEEQDYAFECTKCKRKFRYHEGLQYGFACDKCGGVLKEIKNKRLIEQLCKEIEELLDRIRAEEEFVKKKREEEAKEREDMEKAAEEGAKRRAKSKPKPMPAPKKPVKPKSERVPVKRPATRNAVRRPVRHPAPRRIVAPRRPVRARPVRKRKPARKPAKKHIRKTKRRR